MLDNSTLDRLIGSAILAPSSHNSQPWVFEVQDDRIRLHADRTRALAMNDPDDRELVMSCGCALQNLRVAAAKEGFGTTVDPLPDRHDEDVLAEMVFSGDADVALARLAEAIPERRTYRQPLAEREIPDGIVEILQDAAAAEGALFDPLREEEETRKAAAGLQASYLNQPVELPELRSKLADLCGRDESPQILMRLGYPEEELPAAPRRRMADVAD